TLLLAYRAAIGKHAWLHPAALLALALVAWWIAVRINYRAETALLLALAVALWALERYAEQGNWQWLTAIPVAGWLLVQMHPSVFFLVLLLGAYAAEFLYAPPAGRMRGQAIAALALTSAVTLALACLNPYGWHQVALPVIALFSGQELMADITEYIPVMQTGYALHFVIMAALAVATLTLQRERRISSGLLLALFGGLTFLYVRNIGLFALMLLPPLVRLALHRCPPLPAKARHFAVAALLAVWLGLPLWQDKLGSGIKPGLFPEQSVAYLKQHLPGGRVLNFIDYGGYLAWTLGPKFMVFIDSHDIMANRTVQLHDDIFLAAPGWEIPLSQYRIDAIFTPAVMQFSGRMIPLVEQLAYGSAWRLVAREPSGMLFLRADLVSDGGLDHQQVWEQMAMEAQREQNKFPDHPDPWAALATAYRALGKEAQAQEAERQYRRLSQ
ncbi:MAG: hypothetical protein ACOY4U_01920, partial [Pseudomonadota bacterium]